MSVGRRGNVVDDLTAALRERIHDGSIPIGSWLRQESIAEEFHVSRQPVREAIRQIEASGLVVMVPNRGALVRGPSPQEIVDCYAVRAELEGYAAERATPRLTRTDEDVLRHSVEVLQRSLQSQRRTSGTAWTRAVEEFHETILSAAANPALVKSIESALRSFPRSLSAKALASQPNRARANAAEHAAVLDAMLAGDARKARRKMTLHVINAGTLVADWVSRQSDTTNSYD